jgi:hypothetical protein
MSRGVERLEVVDLFELFFLSSRTLGRASTLELALPRVSAKVPTVKFNSNKSARVACVYASGFRGPLLSIKCECLDVACASHTVTRDEAMCDDLSPGHIIGTLKRKCVKVAIHYS